MAEAATLPSIAQHGASRLSSVEVDDSNIELKDEEGFVGDKASKGAFRGILEGVRKALRASGEDPLEDKKTDEISKKKLETIAKQRYVSPFEFAMMRFALGQTDIGFKWLSKACEERAFDVLVIPIQHGSVICSSLSRAFAIRDEREKQ